MLCFVSVHQHINLFFTNAVTDGKVACCAFLAQHELVEDCFNQLPSHKSALKASRGDIYTKIPTFLALVPLSDNSDRGWKVIARIRI